MTGPEITAREVALREFVSEQPSAKLENFKVLIREHDDAYEVVISPRQPRAEETGGVLVEKFGGRNLFGIAMEYLIDKQTYEIRRQKFLK